MNLSTTPSTATLPQSLGQQLFEGIAEGERQACQALWEAFKGMLSENRIIVLIVLIAIPFAAYIKFTATGRWYSLASVAYHYLYAGVLLALVVMSGPEIFANPWIDLILLIVYVACFWAVGAFIRVAKSIADLGGRSYR